MAINFNDPVESDPDVDPLDTEDTSSDTSSVLTEVGEHDISAYFVERDGRLFPSQFFPPHGMRFCPYPLPVDGHEQSRLNLQHELLKELLYTNYVGPVRDILRRRRSRRRVRALDLCTGTGKWVIDMAHEFPHVKFTGLDIVPIATRRPPSNVLFEMHDVAQQSRFHTGSVDFIHARDASGMTCRNYVAMLEEASRILRPGGLLLLCEWDSHPSLFSSAQDPSTRIPAAYRFHYALSDSLARVNGITALSAHIPHLLQRTRAFEGIHVYKHVMPIGDWFSDSRLRNLGFRFRESVKVWLDSSRSTLREGGYSDGEIDVLIRDYRNEMHRVEGMVWIYYTTWASRL